MSLDASIITPAISIQTVPTVQAAAYVTGNVVGGLLTFTGAGRASNGFSGGLVQSATATFAAGVTPSCDLILFSANPSGSTLTDKTALAIVSADLAKVLGTIHLTDATSLGSTSLMQSQQQALPFLLGPGLTTLYGVLVIRASATLGSTTDCTVTVQVLQN